MERTNSSRDEQDNDEASRSFLPRTMMRPGIGEKCRMNKNKNKTRRGRRNQGSGEEPRRTSKIKKEHRKTRYK
jgi:hypothetical protein